MRINKYVNTPEFWEKLYNHIQIDELFTVKDFQNQTALSKIALAMIKHTQKQIDNPQKELDYVFESVCKLYNLEPEFVLKNNHIRKREFVEIRTICWYIWNEKGYLRKQKIATNYFQKDHSGLANGIKTVRNLIHTDSEIRRKVNMVLDEL